MSTAPPGTFLASKDVPATSQSTAVDDAETKRDLKGGFEGKTVTQEGDSTEQDPQDRFDQLKENRSLKRWKEELGKPVVSPIGCQGARREAEVKILNFLIQSPGRPDIAIPIHGRVSSDSRRTSLFSLKQGSICHNRFIFLVSNGTVLGLKRAYTIWKAGIMVGNSKTPMGSFGPREEAYTLDLPAETIPSGILVRGTYFARMKVVDEEERCYMDTSYYFEIGKNWK